MKALSFRRIVFVSKSVLCVLLVLNLSVWSVGCASLGIQLPDGSIRILLDDAHPITAALVGSGFEGATAVDVNATTGEFRFVYDGPSNRALSGRFVRENGVAAVTAVNYGFEGTTGEFSFDATTHRITRIAATRVDSDGPVTAVWDTPPVDSSRAAVATGANAYYAANEDIVDMAHSYETINGLALDASMGQAATVDAGTDPSLNPVKDAASSQLVAGLALFSVFAIPAGVLGTILFVIQIAVVLLLFI